MQEKSKWTFRFIKLCFSYIIPREKNVTVCLVFVGVVLLNGRTQHVSRLSSAKQEAEIIGQLLSIESSRVLTGKKATKQAVK